MNLKIKASKRQKKYSTVDRLRLINSIWRYIWISLLMSLLVMFKVIEGRLTPLRNSGRRKNFVVVPPTSTPCGICEECGRQVMTGFYSEVSSIVLLGSVSIHDLRQLSSRFWLVNLNVTIWCVFYTEYFDELI